MSAVLDGMDKAEALAYISRLFDAAQAGAVLWGDALLIKRSSASAAGPAARPLRTAIALKFVSSRAGGIATIHS